MAKIELFSPILRMLEGGYVDDKLDSGGATNAGVTLRVFQEFFGKDKTKEDLKHITTEQYNIVVKKYWDRWKADLINNQSIANILVDFEYNSGGLGIKIPQQILGVVGDGIVGEKTIEAINSANQEEFFNKIVEARKKFYMDIVKRRPNQSKFLVGWLNRVNTYKFSN